MGYHVSAAQAAYLVRRHERIVRTHIANGSLPADKVAGRWEVDVDDLARVPGWHVDAARLAELQAQDERGMSAILARLEALERENRDIRARLRSLEQRSTGINTSTSATSTPGELPTPTPEGRQASLGDTGAGIRPDDLRASLGHYSASGDVSSSVLGFSRGTYTGARTVALADRGAGAPLRFKTKTDAARWLSRHGINERTPKTWRGWPPDDLTPAGVFSFALDLWRDAQARKDWRVTWELQTCTDASCICHDLLAE